MGKSGKYKMGMGPTRMERGNNRRSGDGTRKDERKRNGKIRKI
jgi:hypothetical protein